MSFAQRFQFQLINSGRAKIQSAQDFKFEIFGGELKRKHNMQSIGLIVIPCLALLFSNGLLDAANVYDQVRNANPNKVQTYTISKGQGAGEFVYFPTNPEGLVDDGGIILKSNVKAGGVWIRKVYNTAADPVNLDWFFLKAGVDLTPHLEHLKSQFAPEYNRKTNALFIKLPNIPNAKISHLDWRDLKTLHLLEPDQPISIQRIDTLDVSPRPLINVNGSNIAIDDRIINLRDVNDVLIGGSRLNVTFRGLHSGIGPRSGIKRSMVDASGTPIGRRVHALVEVRQHKDGSKVDLSFNTRNTRSVGIHVWGTEGSRIANKIRKLNVAGRHFNSGVTINGGVSWAHLENIYVSDPYGVGYGFTDRSADPAKNFNNDWAQIGKGVWMVSLKRVTGRFRLQFGGCRWFMSNVDQIGISQEDPLWITSINHHVSGGGPRGENEPDWVQIGSGDPALKHRGAQIGDKQQGQTGKMDHIGSPGNTSTGRNVLQRFPPHHWTRFLRTTEGDLDWYPNEGHSGGKHFPTYSTTLEATAEGKTNYINDFVHLQVGNAAANVNVALLGKRKLSGGPDQSRNHTIVGMEGMPNEAISL